MKLRQRLTEWRGARRYSRGPGKHLTRDDAAWLWEMLRDHELEAKSLRAPDED